MTFSPRAVAPFAALVVGVVGAAALVATGPEVESRSPEPLVPLVRVVAAEVGSYRHVVVTHGTVEPRTESQLVPEVSGRVEWVMPTFASGGFFMAGEPLIRIERRDYETVVKRALANLARAKSEFSRATKELRRQDELSQNDVASAARFDDAINAEKVAQAVLGEARANLEQAERDLERTSISAPFDGRVRSENVDVGQFVSRGNAIATVYSVDYAEVRLPVPDPELAYLDLPLTRPTEASSGPGLLVRLHADFAGARHVWEGRVVRTEGEIDPRTRMVHVVARIEDPYAPNDLGRPPLAAGLFVEAEILGRMQPHVVVLPRAALRSGQRALVVDAENRLRWRDVSVARVDRRQVVLSGGVTAGERICVSALESVVDGMRVRVKPAAAAKAPPTDGSDAEA